MCHHVDPSDIIKNLRLAFHFLGPTIGFLPNYFSTRYLCDAIAMAFLNVRVDGNIICLILIWCFGAMLGYLHVQAMHIVKLFASLMF